MNTFFSIYSVFSVIFFDGLLSWMDWSDFIIPIWIFWLFPISWLFIIPTDLIIYSIVLYIIILSLKIDRPLKTLRKTIIKITFFGFLCDLIVVGLIWIVAVSGQEFINPTSDFYHWYEKIFLKALGENVFENIFAFLTMGLVTILSRIINYKLNKRYTFSKLDIEEEKKKKLALYIAIFTAPYIFFIPLK